MENRSLNLLVSLFIPLFFLSPSIGAAEKVIVQLRWHHQFQFAGYYAALEKGYYRERGLDVELGLIQTGMSPVAEVIENRAQFSQSGLGLLVDHANGTPVVAIAATFQSSPMIFLSTEKSGIKNIQDIAGKRVMLQPDNQSLELLILLQKFNLLDNILRLPASIDIKDLIEGKTDTFNAYASNEPYLLEQQGIKSVIIAPKDYQLDFYGDVIFTSQQFLRDKPEVVAAFREATLRGWRYAINHPEEIIELIFNKYSAKKSKSHLRFEANALREIMLLDFVDIGHMNKARWQRNAEQLNALGLLQENVDLDSFIYTPVKPFNLVEYLPWILSSFVVFSVVLIFLFYYITINRRLKFEVKLRREAERTAIYKAMHDPLTKLPNRYLFQDRLELMLKQNKRKGMKSLMIFIDLDNFKQINDNYGHDEGDKLLVKTGEALNKCLREGDTCARIAGDEFIILINECGSKAEASEIAERIMAELSLLYGLEDPSQLVSASLGVLIIDRAGSIDELYVKADNLMYQAKETKDKHFIIEKLSRL